MPLPLICEYVGDRHPIFHRVVDRNVEIAGIVSSRSGLWMNQIGRNLTDEVDG